MAESGTPTPRQVVEQTGRQFGKTAVQLERAYEEGRLEGRAQARKEFLDWLDREYMKPDVERGSDRATAILKVAQDCSKFFTREAGVKVRGKGSLRKKR